MRTEAVFDFPPAQPWRRNDIEVIPQSRHIGAEVRGVDLANFDDRAFAVIHDAWLKHLVLVFRDQALSDADQIAFSRRFGPPEVTKVGSQGTGTHFVILSSIGPDGKAILAAISNAIAAADVSADTTGYANSSATDVQGVLDDFDGAITSAAPGAAEPATWNRPLPALLPSYIASSARAASCSIPSGESGS